mgnify:CR=1 FL=1
MHIINKIKLKDKLKINLKFLCNKKLFWLNKRIFDVCISILLMPVLISIYLVLLPLNTFLNKGKIFYTQKRMGKDCNPFYAIKFRTMSPIDKINRKFNDPIEYNRITPLGSFLRKSRFDEVPQIINVIKGEMSLIGPRPDYYEHALIFCKNVKGYKDRHIIRPGITGLSQIRLGYVSGLKQTEKKAFVDNYYIKNIGYILEIKIIINTLITIVRGLGR